MYVTLMSTLRSFLGTGVLKTALIVALAAIVVALAAWASSAFRAGCARWHAAGGWRTSLAGLGGSLLKVLTVFVLVRLVVTAMYFQAQGFEQQFGRVTEKNRSAVLMKWGCPHEQRELTVTHTRKRIWVTRQLKPQEEKADIVSESFWKDQAPPIQAINGKMPILISTREELQDVEVPQRSIMSADVAVHVRNNPRQLGNANYAGYDDRWTLRYVLANSSDGPTTAHLRFALPAETGLFDDLYLRMNGSNCLDLAKSVESGLGWDAEMAPGAQSVVEIGYRSRGLEHLRYVPKRMSQTGHYRVSIQVEGIPPEKLDYPIGSMPPEERLGDLRGDAYTLTWKLDNALTSYDIGIKLPLAEQPRYHYARLLREAPIGLVILAVLFVLPRLILAVPVRVGVLAVMCAAYFLLYTLMGHMADVLPGFWRPFSISAALLTVWMTWFRLKDCESKLLGVQDALAFGALAILYPLAVIDADRTAFWVQIFLLPALAYFAALMVRGRVAAARPSS